MKRLRAVVFLILSLALMQLACNAPVSIPMTGTNVTGTPGAPFPGTGTPPGAPPNASDCTNLVTFVSDVNVPDNTTFQPGQTFTKTWRVKNDGTCAWGPNGSLTALVYAGGDKLGSPAEVPLPSAVAPGQTADVSVQLTAPGTPGTYVSQWMFKVANPPQGGGSTLGVGENGKGALYVQIVVK
jgi:hypothetical protein